MATKKKSSKGSEFGAKAEFVRSTSKDLSAKDVVDAAAKKGIKLTPAYVYVIRSKAGTKKPAKPGPKPPGSKAASGSKSVGNVEVQLRNAIAQIGLAKAREILAQVEAAFTGR